MENLIGGINYNIFNEEIVIEELLANSLEFKSYYESRRKLIKRTIYWALDSSLETGIEATARRHETGEQIILLRRVPAPLTDAFIIAHELEHLVMDYEGFAGVKSRLPNDKTETLALTLNGMIHDTVVNSRLESFGFDFKTIYEQLAKHGRESFKKLREPGPDKIEKLQWIFQTVSFMLAHNIAYKTWPDKRWIKTMKKSRYPGLTKYVRELTQFILVRGFDTPEKQRKLLNKIIDKYHLEELLVLHNFDNSVYNDSTAS